MLLADTGIQIQLAKEKLRGKRKPLMELDLDKWQFKVSRI